MSPHVTIIGAGLAGLAATLALAARGWRVTLLEARSRLGGRAGSFTDPATGELIDACQHVSMGCCTAYAHFLRTLGLSQHLQRQPMLHFLTPDGRTSRWQNDPLPPPLHLARSFAGAHFLSPQEKLLAGLALADLRRVPATLDQPLLPWLRQRRQTPRLLDRFWGPVLISALNENLNRAGLKYARKVFVDAFLTRRTGGDVWVPAVPLDRLYGDELRTWLRHHRVELRLESPVKEILVDRDEVVGLLLRSGETMQADAYLAAVPWHRLLTLIPEEAIDDEPAFANLRRLEPSPITSVHLWYDRPLTALPHAVLLDGLGQWLFTKPTAVAGEHYHQVVISAARSLSGVGPEEIQKRIQQELAGFFPGSTARLLRARVVTEKQATFSPVPGVDVLRPPQRSPIRRLFLAGDWTATDWPATMEGAVRSGFLAARAIAAE